MANLKATIGFSRSKYQKITEAMRLVAAARVRRAQQQVIATRPLTAWRKCYTVCKPVCDLKP